MLSKYSSWNFFHMNFIYTPHLFIFKKQGGGFLDEFNKIVDSKLTAPPLFEYFDYQQSEIICKVIIGVTFDFGVVGVRWG